MSLVRTEDVIAFCDAQINWVMHLDVESKAAYLKAKDEFENKFFAKLFRSKYYGGWGFWDHCFTEGRLDKYRPLRAEAVYLQKLKYIFMECNREDFFLWCEKNNVPY